MITTFTEAQIDKFEECVRDHNDGPGRLEEYVTELSQALGDEVDMASVEDILLDRNLEACSCCHTYCECWAMYPDGGTGQTYCADCNPNDSEED